MRPTLLALLSITLSAAFTPLFPGAAAQTAQAHIAHILDGFPAAPNGSALLAVADADAALAVEHARLAGRNQTDVGPMVQHARHVMQILDPAAFANGPGSGLGAGPAARAIAQHAELAAQATGATDGMRQHAQHVAAAARAVATRTDAMIELARLITRTSDYVAAYDMVLRLQRASTELASGVDASGDGQIAPAEGGLALVRTHMGLMRAATAAP
jgi:hypothetical protein